jgi:pimeloyl-ACP methyl ester carboxylesterase
VTRVVVGVAAVVVMAVVAFVIWGSVGVMQPEDAALQDVRDDATIELTAADGAWVLRPVDAPTGEGLVFFPGAKVDALAYASVLAGLVREGVTVVIATPPLHVALIDPRPLSAFTDLAPSVDEWAVGGHSLGGVRACQLAASEDADALVLFASYCATDLSDSGVDVLSVSGSEDGLSTPAKIEEALPLLPADATLVEIAGANHASFGDYGSQSGDGEATIDADAAHEQIDDAVLAFLAER